MWIFFYFVIAIGLFTLQNICFKQFNSKFMQNTDSYFIFSAIYFALICGIYLAFGLDTSVFTLPAIALGLMFAVSFILAMFFYMKAMEHGPLGLSFLFFSAGMLWPILFGIIVHNQPAPLHNGVGLVLLFIALYVSTRKPKAETSGRLSRTWVKFILLSSVCNGIIGIAIQLFSMVVHSYGVTEFLFLSFGQAAIISLVVGTVLLIKNKGNLSHFRKPAFAWVALGTAVTTAGGNYIMVALTMLVSALLQFPVINGALVITSILASRIVFKEKVTKNQFIAIAVGLAAIILLSI
ncbi:MAG: EamA family transporter [Defluviitaleaceae bacterium]|nr:EamA family transporter [Defluviitaleaceae bacterium]